MQRLLEILRRLAFRDKRSGFDRELEEEIRFHIETRAAELAQSGVATDEAARRARRELGSTLRLREEVREAWQLGWLEDLMTDLRLALRGLGRAPGFAAAAILSLALGIGANTTIFSLTMEFLFSEPSCRDCGSLAAVRLGGNSHAEPRAYEFVRDAAVFEALTGYREEAEVNWRHTVEAYRIPVMRVVDNYFEVTGVPVMLGRGIEQGERDVAVLSFDFWRLRFDSDPDVLGRSLVLDGRPHTVVGVLPRDHRTLLGFGFAPSMYLPALDRDEVALIARLPAGVPRPALVDRLQAVCTELDRLLGSEFKLADNLEIDSLAGFDRLQSHSMMPFVVFFSMLMTVVGLVLLIACLNVASLLLARSSSRQQELAVRLALGARRMRVVRQLLAESLLLAGLGAVGGLALNLALTAAASRITLPLPIPIKLTIEPDWRLLLYSAAVAVGAAVIAGLLPALKSTGRSVQPALQRSERQVGHARWDLRKGLVVGQIAVSFLLLVCGALFLRNLIAATGMHPGFDADRLVWALVRLTPERYASADAVQSLGDDALDGLRGMAGVEAASIVRVVPFNDGQHRMSPVRTDSNDSPVQVGFAPNRVGADYFRTMGIPILAGREFQTADFGGEPAAVIVNRDFARQVFGDRNPIGRTIRLPDQNPKTVIALAGSIKHLSLNERDLPALYEPYAQADSSSPRGYNLNLMIRTRNPRELVRPIKELLGAMDSTAAVEVKPMNDAMGLALLPSQVGGGILSAMGALGLALAAVGLYGVLAYAVSRRTREIGVRAALGAKPAAILWMILRQGAVLTAAGMLVGSCLAALTTPLLTQFFVPSVTATDPAAIASVVLVLGAVAGSAALGPALRAIRVDPTVALRYD